MSTTIASASSSSSSRRGKMWTRQELLRNLEIIGDLGPLLPPTLSLPSSRSRSNAPAVASTSTLKRKPEAMAAPEQSKRPRTGSISRAQPSPRPSDPPYSVPRAPASVTTDTAPVHPHRPMIVEPSEEGELQEDIEPIPSSNTALSIQRPSTATDSLPMRRPKQGALGPAHFDKLHNEFHTVGRTLKYSGDSRFWSTYAPTNKEYRPLPDPPPPNSMYAKHGGIIARLELLDALVSFTYALWCKDYGRRQCTTLTTLDPFLNWCRQKWTKDLVVDDAEKALVGLIFMIDSFVHARKAAYLTKQPSQMNNAMDDLVKTAQAAVSSVLETPDGKRGAEARNPQMLPSPASVAPTNSANSTPNNRANGTPSTQPAPVASKNSAPDTAGRTRTVPGHYYLPNGTLPENIETIVSKVTVPVPAQLVGPLKDVTSSISAARRTANEAQKYLTLPMMARHFPRTFARMIHSTLNVDDEHEPTFDDDEGELYWPGQALTGEGLGWVCLMGQSMIKEFGKQYGYRGVAGAIIKPLPSGSSIDSKPSHDTGSSRTSASPFPHSATPVNAIRGLPPRPSTQSRR